MHEIPCRTSGETAPASFAQELFFLLDRSTTGPTPYGVPRALRLRGRLDADALQRALDAIVARHEVLRTTYEQRDGVTLQRVHTPRPVVMQRVDLRGFPAAQRESALAAALLDGARARIDLTADQLLGATLLALGDDDHALIVLTHHIASDGWSKSVFFRELSTLYGAYRAGGTPSLPALPIQVADHAAWERSPERQDELAEHLAYWRERLAGPLPVLELPTDRPRSPNPGAAGSRATLMLPAELVAAVKRFASERGATFYMVLLAIYQTLLHRYSGQPDVVVGSPIAGRGRPELEGLIGYFANTLPLRTSFHDDESFAALLDRVVETCLDAFEHEEVPLEQLALQLQQDGRPATTPLFQAVLTMEDTVPAPIALDGVAVEPIDIAFDATKFDLTMMIAEQEGAARVALWYRTELFDAPTVDRMLGHFRTLLESAIARPDSAIGDLPMLSAAEREQLDAWSPAPRALDTRLLPAAFAAMATAHPSRTAIVSGADRISYAELDARARALAGELHARGVRAGDRIGLLADRSADAIAGILAVWYAGGAYVALTPDLPPARLARITELAGIRIVLTQRALDDGRLPGGVMRVALDGDTLGDAPYALESHTPEQPAYVLFTSGSTGEPKGVVVTHGNVAQYTAAIVERLGASATEPWRWATVSTLAADLGHTAIFPALATGGTLHVVPASASTDATVWLETMTSEPIDVLKITPSHLRALLGGDNAPIDSARLPLRWLVLGGEALPWTLAEQVLAANRCRVLNHYGPTEATVGACTLEVTRDAVTASRLRTRTVPIGRALPHAAAEVLDARGDRVPVNVAGELWLGGFGVAQGYLDRDALTAERFVERDGVRWYRTGDRVRRLPEGTIEFLGRGDGQVKIRGYRVELGEVERALAAHPGVSAAAATLLVRDGDARLVGYAVARAGGYAAAHANAADPACLTAWAAERLPEYMVPSALVMLDALPLTANGKLDRGALPDPDAVDAAEAYVAPRTETESMLAAIWCDVLKKERVGVTDSFIALGGHSLLAIRALGKISKQLGVRLPLRTLFDTPTIEEIARRIDAERAGAADEVELARILAQVEAMPDASLPLAPRGTPEPTT